MFRRLIGGGVCTSETRMDGKTVLITGANSGIGKETTIDLARRGARVIMACRDMKRGEDALKDVVEKTGSSKIVLKQLDLASLSSIRSFAEDINQTETGLHVLIDNAGVMVPSQLQKTEDGFEMQMGVNHLGHFLLTNLLIDILKSSQPSRIVVVSSIAHSFVTTSSNFDFSNINSEKNYKKWNAYGQSKMANILFTRELARRLEGTRVTANSLHPGLVVTDIHRHLGVIESISMKIVNLVSKSPTEGAQTSIHLAVSEEVEGMTGFYFVDCKVAEPARGAKDDEAARKLWKVSAELVGLNTTI